MRKKVYPFCLVLFFSMIVFCLAAEENLTISTLYPSPYGVHNVSRTRKMIIGEINPALAPAPSDGAVTFAHTSEPSVYSRGTLYFDSVEKSFKYYNGTAWNKLSQ